MEPNKETLIQVIDEFDNLGEEKFLNFEEPIKELAQKLSALRTAAVDSPALNDEILNLEKENKALTKKIYSKLDTWQIVQVARHPNRPHTSDFIARKTIRQQKL